MRIYVIKNTINNKIYIGQTIKSLVVRFNDHKKQLKRGIHSNPHLQAAWNKYGPTCWQISLLNECSSIEHMNELEIKYISNFNSTDRTVGYNIRCGGDGGGKHDQETKNKISKLTKLQWQRDRNKLNNIRKTQWSTESRKKMKDIITDMWLRQEYVEKQLNTRRSESTRKKLKESAQKNKHITSSQVKARWADTEYKRKVSESIKKSNTDAVKARRSASLKQTVNNSEFKEKFKTKMKEVLSNQIVRDRISKGLSEYFGKVQSPDGSIYEVIGLRRFCREHNLSYSPFRSLKYNPNKIYKGWKFLHEDNN